MKRGLILVTFALALATPALAQPHHGHGGLGSSSRGYANPTAGIAADIELARMTGKKKGRWHALRETAAPDAVMFVPQMVLAQSWLDDRRDSAPAFSQDPLGAWASCDGSLIVTHGARRESGRKMWYTAVWQRQEDGAYRWVFEHSGQIASALGDGNDMIEARVADCPARRRPATEGPPKGRERNSEAASPAFDPMQRSGQSRDGTLIWKVTVTPDGSHRFIASMMEAGQMREIRDETVDPSTTLPG